MQKSFIKVLNLILIVTMIFSFRTGIFVNGTDNTEKKLYLSDGNEQFGVFDREKNTLVLHKLNGTKMNAHLDNQKQYTDFFACNGCFYLTEEREMGTVLTKITEKETTCFILSDILIKEHCFVPVANNEIYVTDKRHPDTLMICSNNDKVLKTIPLPEQISSLFFSDSEHSVIAITEKGLFHVRKGIMISCDAPEGTYTCSGNLLCDENNHVYSINETDGLTLLFSLPYEHSVITTKYIYAATDKTIYQLDFSGRPISFGQTNSQVTALLPGKETVAYLTDHGLAILNKTELLPVSPPVPHLSEESEITSRIPQNKNNSKEIPESNSEKAPDFTIFTDSVRIAGDYIFLDTPVTAAGLKKAFEYHDNTVSFQNQHGKAVKSGNVGTSWKMIFTGNSVVTYTICLKGDVTGEGNINRNDVNTLTDYLFGKKELNDAALYAADTDENSIISLQDLYSIFKSA